MTELSGRQKRLFPQVSVYLQDAILDVVEQIAASENKKRSEVIRELVSFALVQRGLLAA